MTRAFIAGCAGPVLGADEQAFFRDAQPWGFILFKRNIEAPDQVRRLTAALRETVGRDAPVLIDQEGGRVQRMGPPHWPKYPPGAAYAQAAGDPGAQAALARLGARLIAQDLHDVGIDVDCVPCLDVPVAGAHDVIGNRAYGNDPETVIRLGRAAAEGLLAGGVLPIVKHMPGHGRAGADSHHALPVVDASRAELETTDFRPFRALADMPMAMTAHVVYRAIDPDRPATTSAVVMREIVRGHLAYDGLVMSDDLSMNALAGSLGERARAAFAAGCDMALHCNGDLAEMGAVAAETPALAGEPARRAAVALALRRPPEPLPVDARARFEAALAAAA
ncbi:MAG TPA: beta-N-acetylhexosaminidase [Beijerinckiaceae bacterium]|nr:beta-N-acetylhexosaminidase [Beijerinckiaceae bacterium]